jgi:transposase
VIQLTPQMRILLAVEPADFRCGIDGLRKICKQQLGTDPIDGTVVIFKNRRGTSVKLITFDSQGFWLAQKRLSEGHFRWWPKRVGDKVQALDVIELQLLLWNGDPSAAGTAPAWRRVPTSNAMSRKSSS